MSRHVTVHLVPSLFEPSALRGGIAVVIDVLRATTTIACALANGARRIIPCEHVEQARDVRDREGPHILLGGERNGKLIPGFDLDNSPAAWSAAAVGDREIAFTTTNGTHALLRASQADRVITAAFVNLSAVIGFLQHDKRPIHMVCAGTDGHVAVEDTLLAGAIVAGLASRGHDVELNDAALLVRGVWQSCATTEFQRLTAIRSGLGATNLIALEMAADIETAAQIDRVDLVPEYLPQSRELRAARYQ